MSGSCRVMRHATSRAAGVALSCVALAACTSGRAHPAPADGDAGGQSGADAGGRTRIVRVPLGLSNGYLLRGPGATARVVLVDPGSQSSRDSARIGAALAREGLSFRDVALVVLTHGHADHAGGTLPVRRASGAPVVAGRGDTAMLRHGRNDVLRPMGMEARMVRLILRDRYPPLEADVWLGADSSRAAAGAPPADGSLDLRPYGIAGVVILVPGHTAGSLAVLLDSGDVVAGDVLRGGLLGGRIAAHRPAVHYFHADRARATTQICALLARGVERFHVGHGGPLARAAVERRFGRECAARARAGASAPRENRDARGRLPE